MKLAMIVALAALLTTGAQAQSLKEKYELSERCGKRAAEFFAKEWSESRFPKSPGITTHTSFEKLWLMTGAFSCAGCFVYTIAV